MFTKGLLRKWEKELLGLMTLRTRLLPCVNFVQKFCPEDMSTAMSLCVSEGVPKWRDVRPLTCFQSSFYRWRASMASLNVRAGRWSPLNINDQYGSATRRARIDKAERILLWQFSRPPL